MRPDPNDLPAALRPVATTTGLEYLPFLPPGVAAFPVACAKLPIFKEPSDLDRLPIQMNFHSATLDLDTPKDKDEYRRIMTYLASGYGMRLVHIERVLVNKTYNKADASGVTVKKRRKVRRVYIEYYAPYRVSMGTTEQE